VTWAAYYANSANTFGSLASPTRTLISTGTFTVTATLTRYNTNITVPSAATTGIEIELSVAAQTSGTWDIGNFQLELGSVATTFEQRTYGLEFALCQRYYQPAPLTRYQGYVGGGTQNVNISSTWPPMRVAPTVIATYSQTNTTGAVLGNITTSGATFGATVTATGSFDFSVSANSSLSAEL
jgi:hypothetical protein